MFDFRYDGPRQRYLVRTLDPVSLYRIPGADCWTAYAGDTPIQDFVYDTAWPRNVVPTMDYISGLSEVDLTGGAPRRSAAIPRGGQQCPPAILPLRRGGDHAKGSTSGSEQQGQIS